MMNTNQLLDKVLNHIATKQQDLERTGWPLLDVLLKGTGITPKHTVVIGDDADDVYASLVNLVCAQIVDNEKNVLLISPFKEQDDLIADLLCMAGNIPRAALTKCSISSLPEKSLKILRSIEAKQLRCGKLPPQEFAEFLTHKGKAGTPSQLSPQYDVLVVDSIQSFITGNYNSYYEEFSTLLRGLQRVCTTGGVSVVYGSSSNRRGQAGKRKAINIRDSGIAEELADLIISIDSYRTKHGNQRLLRLVKPFLPDLTQLKFNLDHKTLRFSL
jgi:hypothetical protein